MTHGGGSTENLSFLRGPPQDAFSPEGEFLH